MFVKSFCVTLICTGWPHHWLMPIGNIHQIMTNTSDNKRDCLLFFFCFLFSCYCHLIRMNASQSDLRITEIRYTNTLSYFRFYHFFVFFIQPLEYGLCRIKFTNKLIIPTYVMHNIGIWYCYRSRSFMLFFCCFVCWYLISLVFTFCDCPLKLWHVLMIGWCLLLLFSVYLFFVSP